MSSKQPWLPKSYPDNTKPRAFRPTLRDRTYNALRGTIDQKKETLRSVSAGADISLGWLRMFSLNKIPDPAVSRIEKLYRYLTNRVL
jgi:hypothetical protein